MPSTFHKFLGQWGSAHQWEGARTRIYNKRDEKIVSENWIIGKKEGAENFALRYYEVEPRHSTREEHHAHDHGIVVIQGQANAKINGEIFPVQAGDVLYIAPNDTHVLRNTGEGNFGFLCIIPAKREKDGQIIWAEGDEFDNPNAD